MITSRLTNHHAYLVWIPEQREAYTCGEPPEPWYPTGVFIAESRGQAKTEALSTWAACGVYADDFTALRVATLERYVDEILERFDGEFYHPVKRGELQEPRWAEGRSLWDRCWARAHEVLDHGGEACRCTEVRWDNVKQDWVAV